MQEHAGARYQETDALRLVLDGQDQEAVAILKTMQPYELRHLMNSAHRLSQHCFQCLMDQRQEGQADAE